MRFTSFVASAFVIALAASANANSLTTLFATNNSGSAGGMVYFDLAVGATPISITGFDTNTSAVVPFGFSVYTIAGTYVGNTSNAIAWTLKATGTGTGMGTNIASPVSLSNSFQLNSNTTYGIALGMGPEAGHSYTNGTGSNQSYSDSFISLSLGAATNTQFAAGAPFSPRVWNGTVYYTPVPEPASMAVLGIGALALLRRRRK